MLDHKNHRLKSNHFIYEDYGARPCPMPKIDSNPQSWIFATGSTPSRTRLYQIGIAKYHKELAQEFDIFGQIGENWELFELGNNYSAFLAKKR